MLNNVVIIDNIIVRQDVFERYCLSDLHKAADKQDRQGEMLLVDDGKGFAIWQESERSGQPSANHSD